MRREAEEFLRENLSAPAAAKDMEEHARAVGISSRTLARARKRLGVIAEKGGMDKGWTWHLPGPSDSSDHNTAPKNAKPPEECHPKDWQPSAKLAAFGAASTGDNDADPDLSVPATNGGGALADDGGNVDRAPGAMPIEGEIVQPPSWRELNTKMMKSRRWRPTGGNAPK